MSSAGSGPHFSPESARAVCCGETRGNSHLSHRARVHPIHLLLTVEGDLEHVAEGVSVRFLHQETLLSCPSHGLLGKKALWRPTLERTHAPPRDGAD